MTMTENNVWKENEQTEKWGEEMEQEAQERIARFLQEDDEAFFARITNGLTKEEIEEFVRECPEYQKFVTDIM